eukprot:3615649-Amphidinium_carterae.1
MLVIIQISIGTVYKTASRTGSKRFAFSTTSAVAIAEMVKFCLSLLFLIVECAGKGAGERVQDISCSRTLRFGAALYVQKLVLALHDAFACLSWKVVRNLQVMAFLYAFNNQLSLYVSMYADPGTVFLFKSGATLLVALTQRITLGRTNTDIQWAALCIQTCGVIVVQYNPCKQQTVHDPFVYLLLSVTVLVTTTCTVWNEYAVKQYQVPLNLQNMVLYTGGIFMNTAAFIWLPNPNSDQPNIGFFDGYTSWSARGVVGTNAVVGMAITAVYKHADAMTKQLATDTSTVSLMAISIAFFNFPGSVVTWAGVATVLFAVHLYLRAQAYVLKDKAHLS